MIHRILIHLWSLAFNLSSRTSGLCLCPLSMLEYRQMARGAGVVVSGGV